MAKKFLIGQLASYGDCLYATTIAKQIKHDYPNSHITWAIASRYKSILNLNPHIDAVWEITPSYGDLFTQGWITFKKEALKKKALGEFDEIIFSQISPHWTHFDGTIRTTTLSAYSRPITVSRRPVIRLSDEEISNVSIFAKKNNLALFKKVILFECAPTSGQSKNINLDFALYVSKKITETRSDVCFILSSPTKVETNTPQIIDASELSFRENAELTKYCTLLIGCSSGLTWLATSDWAKKLPMIQLLDKDYGLFYGVKYDLELNGLDNNNIIEITTFSKDSIIHCIQLTLDDHFEEAKAKYHEIYIVSYENFRSMVILFLKNKHPFAGFGMLLRYKKKYKHLLYIKLLTSLIQAYWMFFLLVITKSGNFLRTRLK